MMADPSPAVDGPRLESDQVHLELDIAIADDDASTVIHVRGPGTCSRMSDVGDVFDKLGVDVISCSTMPSAGSCDMTLVVVDRHDSQPLDDCLKQNVKQGLRSVLQRCSAASKCTSDRHCDAAAWAVPGVNGGGSVAQQQQQQQQSLLVPVGAGKGSSADSRSHMDLCRADSASESILSSKACSRQPSFTDTEQQQQEQQHETVAASALLGQGSSTAGAGAACPAAAADAPSTISGSHVRFSLAATPHAASPCNFKPVLKIDIPSEASFSSTSHANIHRAPLTTAGDEHTSGEARAASSSTAVAVAALEQQQQQQEQQNQGLQAQDLVQRLMQLGLHQRQSCVIGSDSDSDSESDAVVVGSAGGSAGKAPKWVALPSRSTGDLLSLARQQQQRKQQPRAGSTEQQDSPSGAPWRTVGSNAAAAAAAASAAATPRTTRDQCLSSMGLERSSHSDNSLQWNGLGAAAGAGDAAAGAVPASPAVGKPRRRPPARTPSRIILSPVAADGSADPQGQPKLFISIPKQSAEEKRSARRPVTRSATCHNSLATTPISGGRQSVLQMLLGSHGCLGKLTIPGASPKAAAAAAAAAGMPYNVAVAAAQLLGNHGSTWEAAAAAIAAAVANEQQPSSPLGSPVAAAASSAVSSAELLSSPMAATPRGMPLTPARPVHPAVAAAAAAAIAAAAAEAGEAAAAADGLAGGTIEEGEELSSCASSANDADAEQDEDVDGSSSEEWWCGSLTGLTVRDIMTGPVKVVNQDADVAVARQLMVQHNLPGMLVDTGPGSEPGFLTRRDFFKASITRRGHRRKHPKASTVRDIMSHPVIAVDAGQPIELCAQMMQERGIRRAAVRCPETADPAKHMAEFVGLVSDASIFRCLGLYPDDSEGQGLLVLGNHSAMQDSSADGSGVDTPYNSSRAGTPVVGPGGAAHGGAGGQQQLQQARLGQAGAGGPGSAAADEGGAGAGAAASPVGTPKRMPSLLTLPDIVMMREGLRLGDSNASSSSAGSMSSTRSAAAAAGAAGIGRLAPSSAAGELDRAGTAGHGDPGSAAGGELLGGGSIDSAGGGVGALGLLGSSSSGAPDALSRYRTAAALWQVDMSEIEMVRRIGEGSFGEVMLANYRGTKVAVKRLRVLDIDVVAPPLTHNNANNSSSSTSGTASSMSGGSRGASQAAFRQFFEREIAILASIRHPNVVNFIGACQQPGQRCLVTEYCARGSLDQVLHKSGVALDLLKRVEFAMDIARGMACLHAQRPIIIHRDLKTANLLVSARYEVKVADFGLSRIKDASHLQVSRAGLEGTIEYCAPEVLRGEPYTERCDVYSFGVVLWELLLRQRPYSDADVPVFLLMVNIGNGSLQLPDIPVEAATPGLVQLAEHCLSFGAADRPDFREVLQLLEVEYRALRASQPRVQQRQPSQTQQQAPAVLRCDSASSMAVHQSPRVTSDTPNDGNTPALQSPAGTCGSGYPIPQHAAAAAGGSMGMGPAPAAEGSGLMFNDPYYQQQILQQLQQQQYFQQQMLHQQQMQQQRSSRLSQADSLTSVTANSGQLFGVPLLFDHQQLLSVPLPQLLVPQHHSVGNSAVNSPRGSQQQGFAAAGPAPPGVRVLSAFGGQHHHTPSGMMAAGGGGSGGAAGGAAGHSSSSKPPRSKQHLSRARSMPVPDSINWEAGEAEGEQHDGGDGDGGLADMLAGESSFNSDSGNYNPGGLRCVSNVSAMSGYSALSGMSTLSAGGAYAPCPPSAQLVFLDPATSSGCLNSGVLPQLAFNPAAGVYVAAQQQVMLTASGQPVLVQQPALMQSYVYPQQPLHQQHSQDYCQYAQQQQGLQFEQQQGPQQQSQQQGQFPVQQGPQQRVVQSSMHQQAVMAAAARGREPGGSGAASPNQHMGASPLSLQGMHRRSSSQGSRGIPALHGMQLGELGGSPTALSARDRGSGSSTPVLGGGVAPAGGVGAPLLLQRLDSLNRSGSASPLSRSGSFSLLPAPAMMQSVDYTGQLQLVGVLLGGSGQSSPIPHHTGSRSRLASSGGAELGSSPPMASYLQSAHMQQHLQATRRPSLLRNESRDRAASPFAAVVDNQAAAGHGVAVHGRSPFAGADASPFAAASGAAGDVASHSPFAAASGASFSSPTDDQCSDVGAGAGVAAAKAAAVGSARSSTPARSPFAAAASPFAAVSGAVDDVDTVSVADTNSTEASPVSVAGGGKGDHAAGCSSSSAAAAAGGHGDVGGKSSSRPAMSPFLLLQQMQTEEEEDVGDSVQQ